MKRRKFLKYLGIGVAGATVAPLLLSVESPVEVKPIVELPSHVKDYPIGDGWISQMEGVNHLAARRDVYAYTNRKGMQMWEDAVTSELREQHANNLESAWYEK